MTWRHGAASENGGPQPRFRHGVASFDPQADRVLLWTLAGGGGPVRWVVGRDPEVLDLVASGEVEVDPEPGTVTVDVAGLDAGRTYWYRFEAGGERSPIGRTRTLPGAGAERLLVGVTCCARYSASIFAVYRALAAADVDVVLHLGDYVYEDVKEGLPGREPDPPHDCVSLADYRARHAQARLDPDIQALHAAHPLIVLWDDHDLADNACRTGAKSHDPTTQGPWADRLAAALRAHQDFLPKRLARADDLASGWRSFDAGSLARIVMTETRAAGRDPQAGLEGAAPADDPDRSLLGPEQRAWLEDQIAGGPTWLLLASGTMISQLTIDAPVALDWALPEKYAVVNGKATNTDQWDGYQAEQGRVVDWLDRRGGGSVILSGDIHSAWAVEGPIGPDGGPVAVELACPPAATKPLGQLLPMGGNLLERAFDRLPHVRWVETDHHGYVTVDVAVDRLAATFWWVDPAGSGAATRGRGFDVLPTRPPRFLPVPADALGPPEPHPLRPLARRATLVVGAAAAAALGAAAAARSRRR